MMSCEIAEWNQSGKLIFLRQEATDDVTITSRRFVDFQASLEDPVLLLITRMTHNFTWRFN